MAWPTVGLADFIFLDTGVGLWDFRSIRQLRLPTQGGLVCRLRPGNPWSSYFSALAPAQAFP